MKVTINVKCINPKFDPQIADDFFDGEESEYNIKFLWEDEFVVKGDILDYKIRNKQDFELRGYFPDGKEFHFAIPDCTVLEVEYENGSIGQFPISRKIISKTDFWLSKNKSNLDFQFYLKGSKKIVNPMDGAYFLQADFPSELIVHSDNVGD